MSTLQSIGSVRPVPRQTAGSVLTDILGAVNEAGEFGPIVSANPDAQGKPYYIMVFEDGCRFNVTVGAINYYCTPTLQDGTPNPDFIGESINPGEKYAMTRDETGRPIIKKLKK